MTSNSKGDGILAGSLGYSLKVANVYQRRFDSESLAGALKGSHLYIITRRPTLRIDRESVRVYEHKMTFDAITKEVIRAKPRRHSLVLDFDERLEVEDFRTYSNDTYFSFRANGILIHGDAWALSSVASNARNDIATQEVLYVGQAYGQDGSISAWDRTRHHSTLQRIYEDHSGEDWGISISPLIVARCERSTLDHIDDEEEATVNILGLDAADPFCDSQRRLIRPTSVDLIEHALITHFSPPYNEMLKRWRPERPTIAMATMKAAGFRLLQVHLDGWQGLARYYSSRTNQTRSHFIMLAAGDQRKDEGRIIYDPQVHNWQLDLLVSYYRELLDAAETSTVILNIFGDEAPRVRRPPEVILSCPQEAWSRDRAEEEHASLIKQPRILHELSGIDPRTGAISIGTFADGQECHWQLVQPGLGVCHGVVAGARGTGKTNLLNILRFEALGSGVFGPLMLVDPLGRHNFSFWGKYAYAMANDIENSIKLLSAIADAVTARRRPGNYRGLSSSTPGILVTLENAHAVFSQSDLAVRAADQIAQFGDSVGVGLVVTVPDLNMARFGNKESLRTALRKYNTVVYGPPDVYEMLGYADEV